MIQNNFVDMENMFELLEQPKDIEDKPDATPIDVRFMRRIYIKEWPDTDNHREIIPKRILLATGAHDEPWVEERVKGNDKGVGIIGEG